MPPLTKIDKSSPGFRCARHIQLKVTPLKLGLIFGALKLVIKPNLDKNSPFSELEKDVNDFPGRYIKVAQDLDLREVQL